MTGEGRGPVFEAAMRMANVASDLRDRIDAALAIHKPCHDASDPRWALCAVGHDEQDDAVVCPECGPDGEDVLYPCPTALALGVEPTERTARP